jgi:hypothetical protein
VNYQGVEYKPVHAVDCCAGCEFKDKTADCLKLPESCMKMYRVDKIGVIWVKDKK